MKKTIYSLIWVLPVFFMTSCLHEEADIFDKSSALRMDEALSSGREALVGASNGWLVNYYPETGHVAGGYAMYWKFLADGTVDVACEAAVNSVPAQEIRNSMWDLKPDQGPVLSFDLYNPVLYYFTQPTQLASGTWDMDGFGGDYEFIIMKISDDKSQIELKGKRKGSRIVLNKVTDGVDPIDYLKQVADLAGSVRTRRNFLFMLNGSETGNAVFSTATAFGNLKFRKADVTYKPRREKREGEETVPDTTVTLYYTFTPTGLSLYEPFKADGVEMANFVWNKTNNKYVCSDPGVNAEFQCTDDTPLEYDDFLGKYTMKYSILYNDPALTRELEVELVRNVNNQSYILKGILTDNTPGNIIVNFEEGGVLSLKGQIMHTYENGNLLWWLPFSNDNYTSRTTTYGLMSSNLQKEQGKIVSFSMVSDGVWTSHPMIGFIVRIYDSAGANVGNVNGKDGQPRYYYPQFIKKNE